jgi:hypothetical protein
VVLNQNAYYSFMGYPLLQEAKTPYMHPEVVAAIVVSQDSKEYLEYVFPKLPVYRIKYSIDPKLYYIAGRKKKQICFMPRKNVEDARQVLNILRYRKALNGWKVVAIEKKRQAEAAEILRDSLVFLSFGHPEGFGLPPAEAMAAEAERGKAERGTFLLILKAERGTFLLILNWTGVWVNLWPCQDTPAKSPMAEFIMFSIAATGGWTSFANAGILRRS